VDGQEAGISRSRLVIDLRVLREAGIVKLRQLNLPTLTEAARVYAPDAGSPGRAIEELLRDALDKIDGDEIRQAGEYIFGVAVGTRGVRPAELRAKAADIRNVSRETFRKHHEPIIIDEIADAIVDLVYRVQTASATGGIHGAAVDQLAALGVQGSIAAASVGRAVDWTVMFPSVRVIRALDLSMPMLGQPALIDHLERLVCDEATDVRLMVLHPNAPGAALRRESPAYKTLDELHTTIEYVIKILRGLRQSIIRRDADAARRFDVRLTMSLPTFCGVLAGNRGFVNIYMEHLTGSRGPYFEIVRHNEPAESSLLGCFEQSFDYQWGSSPSLFSDLAAHLAHFHERYASPNGAAVPTYLQFEL